ncbi:hypothetical protein KY360_05770 [Candidatus Woesearchaeota archaeon]|nr:hypothetical protein [Candidatus Woesearchaeota archaeon]
MQKRAQVTVFIIVGIIIASIFGFVYFSKSRVTENEEEGVVEETVEFKFDVTPIQTYIESCLAQVSEEGVWILGTHGGYIDPDGNPFYGEEGNILSESTTYQGDKIPYYSDGSETHTYPFLAQIEEKLSRYIIVEFERCLDFSAFEDMGFNITKPDLNYQSVDFILDILPVDSRVSINRGDVVVKIEYPITIRKEDSVTKLSDFRISLPIRLGAIYYSMSSLVTKIIDLQTYNIAPECDVYDTNGLTNIYFKRNDNGEYEIIQFVDYETYEHKYLKAYKFQFAIKNVDFSGECVG